MDALRAEPDFKPDAVILDLHMPDIGGYDLARWWRSRRKDSCPLLIAITGQYTQPSDGALARAAGFDYYFTKPYEPSELLRLLDLRRHVSA